MIIYLFIHRSSSLFLNFLVLFQCFPYFACCVPAFVLFLMCSCVSGWSSSILMFVLRLFINCAIFLVCFSYCSPQSTMAKLLNHLDIHWRLWARFEMVAAHCKRVGSTVILEWPRQCFLKGSKSS